MAQPSDKVRSYRPLLALLVAELLREFDEEQQERMASDASASVAAAPCDEQALPVSGAPTPECAA